MNWRCRCVPTEAESIVKALIFLGAGKNKLEWQERPDLTVQGDLEAIVRPIASATCDLDREILRGNVPMSQHPGFAIGHEFVAEVLEVGDKVRRHKRGDIVVVPCFVSCGVCVQCRAGMHTHCTTVSPVASDRVYGLPTERDWGGLFSEEVRVPFADGMLVPVPAGVDPVAVASASDNIVEDIYCPARDGEASGSPTLVVGGLDGFRLFVAEQAMARVPNELTIMTAIPSGAPRRVCWDARSSARCRRWTATILSWCSLRDITRSWSQPYGLWPLGATFSFCPAFSGGL